MTTKNLLYCLGGLLLGFAVGFLIANRLNAGAAPAQLASLGSQSSSIGVKEAPALDPSQDASQLPPGHPDISQMPAGGANAAGPDGAAATDAEAQSAMEAADAKPQDFDLQLAAARTFARLKALDKSAAYFERALKLRPNDFAALVEAGNTKYDTGDFAGAADYYTRALAVRADADVQTDLGNTYFQRTPPDFRRAIDEYRKTLAIDPRHEKALQNMASAALNLRDKATAREAIDKLAAANPNNPTLAPLRASLDNLP